MATYIISTCGLSLLEATCWDPWHVEGSELRKELEGWSGKLGVDKSKYYLKAFKTMDMDITRIKDEINNFTHYMENIKDLWKDNRFNHFPAELASIYKILNCKKLQDELSDDLYFYFVYPDAAPNRGIFQVIKNMLCKLEIVSEDRIREISLANLANYVTGIDGNIKTVCEDIIRNIIAIEEIGNEGNIAYFNLTGGYKSFLLAFQHALISQKNQVPVLFKIFNYFENAKTFTQIFSSKKDSENLISMG